jgi:hypothetical protein
MENDEEQQENEENEENEALNWITTNATTTSST